MAPFRPTNLNKRLYPGNAGVIGPTCAATLGISTTNCCSSTASCGSPFCQPLCLGCRCSYCASNCCNICCSCPCTVCDRTVPSGRWKASEQYEAKTRDAWGDDNCVTGSPTCLCCTNIGITNITNLSDCMGFFICCGPGACKWFVAPCCAEVIRSWYCRAETVNRANEVLGGLGWFLPDLGVYSNPGWVCRAYWDCYASAYWSHSNDGPHRARAFDMSSGGATGGIHKMTQGNCNCLPMRAFRYTT